MAVRHDHWIGGKAHAPANREYLSTIDPTTRAAGDEIAAGTTADVERAVAAAAAAQPEWARRSAADRADVLRHVADAVEADADELIELERACTGKIPAQLRMEVDMSVAYLEPRRRCLPRRRRNALRAICDRKDATEQSPLTAPRT